MLNSELSLIFLGDNHGNWNELMYYIRKSDVKNANIVSVGDLGIGFRIKDEYERGLCSNLSKEFSERNLFFYGIRGNHDNPRFFQGNDRILFSNFQLIEDYAVSEYKGVTIQFVGGAISIDRTGRKEDVSYWTDESVVYKPNLCKKVDVLVTHTAPPQCFPQTFNEIVYSWAREDAYLIEDLIDERAVMGEIFKLCSPKYHFYGHFHSSWQENVNGCLHRLLNINELYEANLK